jgi:hypothetical protein
MKLGTSEKLLATASINLAHYEARLEKISGGEAGKAALRISGVKQGKVFTGPLTLSEAQLIELLHSAIHAGVVSPGFIGKMREKIEI